MIAVTILIAIPVAAVLLLLVTFWALFAVLDWLFRGGWGH